MEKHRDLELRKIFRVEGLNGVAFPVCTLKAMNCQIFIPRSFRLYAASLRFSAIEKCH